MQSFKDLAGQHWEIKFTVLLRRKIRQRVEIDILSLLEQATLTKLAAQPELWVDIIWACLESQANERRIEMDSMFTDRIDQDLMDKVSDLMFDESIEFAPEKKRATMRKLLNIYSTTGERTIQTLTKHIENIDAEKVSDDIQAQIERSLLPKSTNGKTSLPEPLEFLQPVSASES